MIPSQIKKEHILMALDDIDKNEFPKRYRSTDYLLEHNWKLYPPKYAIMTAYQFVGKDANPKGQKLDVNRFNSVQAINFLKDPENGGFNIINVGSKEHLIISIYNFVVQSQTEDFKIITKSYIKKYKDLDVDIGFGQGTSNFVTYMGFLKEGNKISNGIYPVFLYERKSSILYLAYGISKENKPVEKWPDNVIKNNETIGEKNVSPLVKNRYPESYYYKEYPINTNNIKESIEQNTDYIIKDLDNIINIYINIIIKEFSLIPLAGKKLYKISLGNFKAKKYADILNTFKQNHWVGLHEKTGKAQAELFKNGLHAGDYVYITVGADELFAIAKIKSDSWEYVPEGIVFESDWIYREVEYVQYAIKTDPYELRELKKFFYPSANSTLFEITPENLKEANENLFKPYFGVEFVPTNLPIFSCNIILYGPPGTGKTYNTIDLAVKIITGKSTSHEEDKKVFDDLRKEGQIEFITFHQNYSYEDFMLGIRPDLDETSTLKFRRKEGIFYKMCKRAEQSFLNLNNKENVLESLKRYVLIIDEINRANISKVFGELITLLEEDKRLGAKNELRVRIPGEENDFGIPPNVYVIGTMNTADKSIAMIDIALRRRFEFIGYFPDYDKVDEPSGNILKHINYQIYTRKKSADYLIGHGYFMNGGETPKISKVIENKVIPLLMEYFSGKTEVVEEIFKGSEWSVKYDNEKYRWNINSQIRQ